jgi:magnesium-transporting ATPase (P-type)
VLEDFRILDYRYMRFSYHPLKDKFVLTNSWKDPAWTDVKSIRAGIDGDEKENRELVFGKNLIDIKQKTIPQLLLDEVCCLSQHLVSRLTLSGIPSFLCVPDCQSDSLVSRSILLLCSLHLPHISSEYYDDSHRDTSGKYSHSAFESFLRLITGNL